MESFNTNERGKSCKFSLSHRLQQLEENFKASGGKFENYKLEDIFTASNGNFDIQQKHINGIGDYVISSGVQNLGIIGKTDVEAKIFPSNTITIDMFGNVYYRDFPYKMVTHARVFSLSFKNNRINSKVGLFISSCMQFLNQKFSYSDMASWEKIKKQKISIYLPTKNNQIDFDYMEERIRVLEVYLKVTGLDKYILTKEEQEAYDVIHNGGGRFKLYTIGSLFNIHPTSAYRMTNYSLFQTSGKIPVVTNSSINNGISGYTKLSPTEKGGIVTYSDTTTSDGIFFQPEDFVGYSHVQGVYPINKKQWNEKTLLFFVSTFRKSAGGRFDYANKFNRNIAKLMNISLPSKKNGVIDYEFMETYIRAIEKKVIKNVVDWKDKEIEKTRNVVSCVS